MTERAWEGWDTLLTRRNVTFTAVAEALGEMLDRGVDVIPEEAIQRAKQIDRERRSRR